MMLMCGPAKCETEPGCEAEAMVDAATAGRRRQVYSEARNDIALDISILVGYAIVVRKDVS